MFNTQGRVDEPTFSPGPQELAELEIQGSVFW